MIKQVYNLNEKSFRNYNGPDKGEMVCAEMR